MANKKPKRKSSIAGKIYVVLSIVLGIMILAMGMIILFHRQSIEVKGLEYNSEQEVVDWINKDEASINNLYMLWKYNVQKPELLPYLDSLKVKLKAPWAVTIEAREKKIVGCIEQSDGNYFFDQEGLVILVSETPVDGIPKIEGMQVEGAALYKKLKTADENVFEHILEVTQLLKKENLQPDKVFSDGKNVTLHFGTITVELGSSGYSHKIVQLPMVLEKLAGETGVLRMKYYNKNSKYISFRKVDPDAEPEEGDEADQTDEDDIDGTNQADEGDEDSEDTESWDENSDGENSEDDGEDWDDSSYTDDEEESSSSLDYGDNIDSSEDVYENDSDEDNEDWE